MQPYHCLNVIKVVFYTKMEYYIFSNEIHMEYVWNTQVLKVIWNIYGVCLTYDNEEYYIFSNEIHMKYVWNTQVPIVIWNIYGI
jgi:hypothetical protein